VTNESSIGHFQELKVVLERDSPYPYVVIVPPNGVRIEGYVIPAGLKAQVMRIAGEGGGRFGGEPWCDLATGTPLDENDDPS
jgi:hypothetical protein